MPPKNDPEVEKAFKEAFAPWRPHGNWNQNERLGPSDTHSFKLCECGLWLWFRETDGAFESVPSFTLEEAAAFHRNYLERKNAPPKAE